MILFTIYSIKKKFDEVGRALYICNPVARVLKLVDKPL